MYIFNVIKVNCITKMLKKRKLKKIFKKNERTNEV